MVALWGLSAGWTLALAGPSGLASGGGAFARKLMKGALAGAEASSLGENMKRTHE